MVASSRASDPAAATPVAAAPPAGTHLRPGSTNYRARNLAVAAGTPAGRHWRPGSTSYLDHNQAAERRRRPAAPLRHTPWVPMPPPRYKRRDERTHSLSPPIRSVQTPRWTRSLTTTHFGGPTIIGGGPGAPEAAPDRHRIRHRDDRTDGPQLRKQLRADRFRRPDPPRRY